MPEHINLTAAELPTGVEESHGVKRDYTIPQLQELINSIKHNITMMNENQNQVKHKMQREVAATLHPRVRAVDEATRAARNAQIERWLMIINAITDGLNWEKEYFYGL